MKVLMFGWEFPPAISGGLGAACFGMTKSLSQIGVHVTFVLPRVKEGAPGEHLRLIGANEVDLSIEMERTQQELNLRLVHVNAALKSYMTEEQYRDHLKSLKQGGGVDHQSLGMLELSGDYGPNLFAEVGRYARVAGHLARMDQYDVIHAHDWMTFPAGVEAKRVSGRPLVIHVHATEFDRSGEHVDQRVYDIERYGMDNADRIIAVSNRTKNMLIERYGVPPEKVDVVYNGVVKEKTISRLESGKALGERIVLFLGRITMQKGPDYFVDAAEIVLRKLPNVRFVMAGAGDMLPSMIERIASRRMLSHFHFTGFLKGAKRERIFAMSDLYVMPSVSEPFGLTPAEAMQFDVPIIISRQSGVAEVLKGAVTVDFWDVQKLAEAMIEVLTNPGLARSVVEQGRADLGDIDWSRAAYQIEAIYKRVV